MKLNAESIALTVVLLLAASACTRGRKVEAQAGPYLGQTPPGSTPELFGPGILSTEEHHEQEVVFSPDGRSLYFTFRGESAAFETKFMRVEEGEWTAPRTPALFSRMGLRYPSLSADGSKLFFVVSEEGEGVEGATPDTNIWVTDVLSPGVWGEPVKLGKEVNSTGPERHPTVRGDGALFFYSTREDTQGRVDIYWAPYLGDGFLPAERVGGALNGDYDEFNPFVAPDGSFLICNIAGLEDSFGGSDLYISFHQGADEWTEPINMGPAVNSEASEFKATLSPDGHYLFFTSTRGGTADVYWMDAEIVDTLRPGD